MKHNLTAKVTITIKEIEQGFFFQDGIREKCLIRIISFNLGHKRGSLTRSNYKYYIIHPFFIPQHFNHTDFSKPGVGRKSNMTLSLKMIQND
jgi:hypothetical protein